MARYNVGSFVHDARSILGNRLINGLNDRIASRIQGGGARRHHHHGHRRAHMVKGSAEARAHMARLRSM